MEAANCLSLLEPSQYSSGLLGIGIPKSHSLCVPTIWVLGGRHLLAGAAQAANFGPSQPARPTFANSERDMAAGGEAWANCTYGTRIRGYTHGARRPAAFMHKLEGGEWRSAVVTLSDTYRQLDKETVKGLDTSSINTFNNRVAREKRCALYLRR